VLEGEEVGEGENVDDEEEFGFFDFKVFEYNTKTSKSSERASQRKFPMLDMLEVLATKVLAWNQPRNGITAQTPCLPFGRALLAATKSSQSSSQTPASPAATCAQTFVADRLICTFVSLPNLFVELGMKSWCISIGP
jgi:hypothetical protein